MSYNYYQQLVPGWGTNQIQFIPPPAPSFHPQPYWSGSDYYRAHAVSPDFVQALQPPPPSSLYNYAVDSARRSGNIGVGIHEARHWHRRIYGGPSEINILGPAELGHAAAYEAYRTWMCHSAVQIPIGADIERQREALIGIAVAESTRLLQLSGRPQDPYLSSTATEAAAHTASQLFYQSRGGMDESRSPTVLSPYQDPYAIDNEVAYQSHPHSRSGFHSRHASFSSTPSTIQMPLAGGYATSSRSDYADPTPYETAYTRNNAPVTVVSNSVSPYSGSSMPVNIPGRSSPYPGSMAMTSPGRTSPYPGGISHGTARSYPGTSSIPYGVAQSYPGTSSMFGTSPSYASTSMSASVPMGQPVVYPAQQQGMYNSTIAPVVKTHGRHRSASFSYPQQTYPQQIYPVQPTMTHTHHPGYNTGGVAYGLPQAGSTTYIIKREHSHDHGHKRSYSRHKHHSRSHSRHR